MFGWLKNGTKNISAGVSDSGKKLLGTEEIISTSKDIQSMAKNILSPKDAIKNARKETFKEAMNRQEVSDFELMQIYRNYTISCYISLVFSVIMFCFIIYNLFFKSDIFLSASLLVFLFFCLVNAFKFSFRSFQI